MKPHFTVPKVDYSRFSQSAVSEKPYYGLPPEIEYCSNCTYSNQKPNSEREYKHSISTQKSTLALDDEKTCMACQVALEKSQTDWDARRQELRVLTDRYRRNDGGYDVLIPGSGGKDSFYVAWILKHEFGMNPLTLTWAPHLYTDWGRRNHQAWIDAGFDNFLFSPNSQVQRLLTRIALENIFHPFQPFMMGQMYFPAKFAAMHGIPLVMYGENPTEYGNKGKNNQPTKDRTYFTNTNRNDIYIGGLGLDELKDRFGLSDFDLAAYIPPTPEVLDEKSIEIHYLGYYVKWHPQNCYFVATENSNFQSAPERSLGTYSKYSSIDDKIDDFHYYTTFIKFGIGRATYDTAQEIRNGDITREEGIALVKRFDGEYPSRFEAEIFEYLSVEGSFEQARQQFEQPDMNRDCFTALTDRFRSPHLWHWDGGKWSLRKNITV